MLLTFVLGLRNVGKTTYIKSSELSCRTWIDLKNYYKDLPGSATTEGSYLDKYEAPTYVKGKAMAQLVRSLVRERDITVEMTGMTKTNQAFILAMAEEAWRYGYVTEYIYIKPRDLVKFHSFLLWQYSRLVTAQKDTTEVNQSIEMLQDYLRGHPNHQHPRWREPTQCKYLYFPVRTILVDHDEVRNMIEYQEEAQERLELARYAQGG